MANYLQKAIPPSSSLRFQLSYEESGSWMNGCLSLTLQGQLNNQTVQLQGHYCKEEFAFQGRYDCSWHMGPSPLLSWLELIPLWGISFDFLVAIMNSLLDTAFFLVSCEKHFVCNTTRNITCFSVEKMSCLSPGCHFWKDATLCNHAVSVGKVLFSNIVLKCRGGENTFGNKTHAPAH